MVTDPSRRELRAAEHAAAEALASPPPAKSDPAAATAVPGEDMAATPTASTGLPAAMTSNQDDRGQRAWHRPRGNRYPEAAAAHDAPGIADSAIADDPRQRPNPSQAIPAPLTGRRASVSLDAEHAAAERLAEAERAAADRRAAVESRTADERLVADRAAVAAQAEALRQAAARNRAASQAVRPAPSIVTPPTERIRERDRPPADRRVLVAGVFAGDAAAPADDRAVAAADDLATRAITVVRPAGPSNGTEASVTVAGAMSAATAGGSAVATAALTPFRRTLIMGILNVTPDSFSDGGKHDDLERAVAHAVGLVSAGADIIDVGGESTRPGAPRVGVLEEQRRVVPVIRELVRRGIRVSIDTMNAATAYAAAEAGADIINDVSGGLADANMAQVAADTDRTFIAMHWRGHSDVMNSLSEYGDVVTEVKEALFQRVAELVVLGVAPDRLVIDPGLGFSKTAKHNWQLLAAFDEFKVVGLPILVAASRKRFLADLVPAGAPFKDRDPATAIISALSAQAGAWAVRVHDVASTRAALDVQEAWKGAERG